LATSNLSKAHETRDSLSSSCSQVVLVYLQPFLCNSLCVPRSKILKNTETPYFENSRSFKVIEIDTIKKLVTSACYNKQQVRAYLQAFLHYTSQKQ